MFLECWMLVKDESTEEAYSQYRLKLPFRLVRLDDRLSTVIKPQSEQEHVCCHLASHMNVVNSCDRRQA